MEDEKMKEKYEALEVEVIAFDAEDVITNSGDWPPGEDDWDSTP
jgi:hypothetical protein